MAGRAHYLPSAGEIQQTPTRQPTETLSKTNSMEGAGLKCVVGRVEGEVSLRLPVGGDSAVLWPGLAACGRRVQGGLYPSLYSGCQVRPSHSFRCQVWKARGSKAIVSYNPFY